MTYDRNRKIELAFRAIGYAGFSLADAVFEPSVREINLKQTVRHLQTAIEHIEDSLRDVRYEGMADGE